MTCFATSPQSVSIEHLATCHMSVVKYTTTQLVDIATTIIVNGGPQEGHTDINDLAKQLISLYNTPFCVIESYRYIAAHATALLACHDDTIVTLVRDDTVQYAFTQQDIGGSSPYLCNSIDVISQIAAYCPALKLPLRAFLLEVGQLYQGMAQPHILAVVSEMESAPLPAPA